MAANVFDRNYFVFDLLENEVISAISFDPLTSGLLSGSALPTAEILSPNQIMTIFGEGVIRELGFNPVFNVTTSAVPVPAAVWFFISGLMGLFGMRKNKLNESLQRV